MTDGTLGRAVVTGASTGLGAIYADRLARRNYDLLLVARDKARLSALAEKLVRETGRSVEVLALDLTDSAQVADLARRIEEDDSFSLLVNNAGMSLHGTLATSDADEVARLVALNVVAPTLLAQAAVKALTKRGKGGIINLSSVLALAPERFEGTYSASKAFLLNLSQSLAAQLKDTEVRVQAVLPGATRTEIWERSGKDINAFPADWVMEADDLVDAALAGFDAGETITIPPLADEDQWNAFQAARLAMEPNLSRREVAQRYRV
ncbi:SDR family oxidoreductase [Rhizobium sp. 1399]|uniref:SDR family NAD(P)-dependent oxidoreductase n=1 Tax=Rhizobium sp. 1399 TaxID=2817758 RepID=UPI0028565699|nr:SDR family oxidoreductase [Rhizobium sp. 1399]MDR6670986.1 short-subunit dehydrogenase [Rhizobium sp. 1399]